VFWLLLKIFFLVLDILFWILDRILKFFGIERERTYEEMREIFKRNSKYKMYNKVMKSNSPGLQALWHQLMIQSDFNIAKAEKKINRVRFFHPFKNDRWLLEKAVNDLDRDRRR
jgi:hypothetical protein